MTRQIIAIAALLVSGCISSIAIAQPETATSPQLTEAQQQAKQQATETLLRELDDLIPGEFSKYPDKEKNAREIIDNFLSGQGAQAVELIKKLDETDPTFPPAELIVASLQIAANNTNLARQNLEAAARDRGDNPGVFIAFARLAISQGRIADAMAHLEKTKRIIDSRNDWSEIESRHFQLGYLDALSDVRLRYQQWELAGQSLNQIEQMLPDNLKTLFRQAEVAYRTGDEVTSLNLLAKYEAKSNELENTVRRPELVLASWYSRDNKSTEAERLIKAANQKYPEDVSVLAEYADFMLSREDYAEARIAIKKIEDQNGETNATKFVKAKMAFAQGAYGLAESHFSDLSVAEPTNYELANLWALSLIEIDDPQKQQRALQVAQQNVRLQQNNPIAAGILGYVLYRVGDVRQAQAILDRAAQAGVNSPEVSYFIAKILSDQGQGAQAKQILDQALAFQGIFLYRQPAKELLKQLEQNGEGLPTPEGNGG